MQLNLKLVYERCAPNSLVYKKAAIPIYTRMRGKHRHPRSGTQEFTIHHGFGYGAGNLENEGRLKRMHKGYRVNMKLGQWTCCPAKMGNDEKYAFVACGSQRLAEDYVVSKD